MDASKGGTNGKAPQKKQSRIGRRALLTILVGGAGGAVLVAGATRALSPYVRAADEDKQVTLYKDPQCGCCESYAGYLREHGFEVRVVPTHDLPLLNEKYGIPTELSPCHISLVAGYVVGGHVPIDVVNRLLSDRPKITGITLPGMPPGSPGMTGQKVAPFNIFEIGKAPYKLYAVV